MGAEMPGQDDRLQPRQHDVERHRCEERPVGRPAEPSLQNSDRRTLVKPVSGLYDAGGVATTFTTDLGSRRRQERRRHGDSRRSPW